MMNIFLLPQQIWHPLGEPSPIRGRRAEQECQHLGPDRKRHDRLLRRDQPDDQHRLQQVRHEAGELERNQTTLRPNSWI